MLNTPRIFSQTACMSQTSTENIYARLIVFYETNVPEKLNSIDLQKIHDTYKDKKPGKLEKDLTKKYATMPTDVLLNEVSRYAAFKF